MAPGSSASAPRGYPESESSYREEGAREQVRTPHARTRNIRTDTYVCMYIYTYMAPGSSARAPRG